MKKWKYFLLILVLLSSLAWLPTSPSQLLLKKLDQELANRQSEFPNAKYAILVDYNSNVFKKRLWIVDLETKEIILNSHVSHALLSGLIWPTKFSNIKESRISSKGVFKTLDSYESGYGSGEYKIGMRLQGLDKGINDNVLERNIVFHCSYGLWSSGCFMTWPKTNKEIIELTKNGSILIVN